MSSTKDHSRDGIQPAPIPPPLEFPYPNTASTSASSSVSSIPSDDLEQKSTQKSTPGAVPDERPRLLRKAMTDRPQPVHRRSTVPMSRRVTGGSTALQEAVWSAGFDSGSDSLSSSDSEDDANLKPMKSKSQSQSRSNLNERRTKALSGEVKDPGDDPYSRFAVGNDQFKTRGKVSKQDGRLKISVSEFTNSGYLAKALGSSLKHHLGPAPKHRKGSRGTSQRSASPDPNEVEGGSWSRPKLNILVMVIGSRGDIQPFLQIGKVLREQYGHRVRIATHPAFKKFVENDSGLEFFSVGGDPAELMAFMVKNPGLLPSLSTVRAGEIGRRRDQMFDMFQGFWRACINSTDDETDLGNLKLIGTKLPFIADAIIANPPCFAHIHCAEKLGIPLHLMFTFPYSPTQSFPHPLANIKKTNIDASYTNFMSYPLVELMTWQGLGDLVNKFRVKTLALEPVSTLWAPGQLYRQKVPHTYLWSPGLVPKPPDWGPEIDIAGFVFLDLGSTFEPPDSLVKFLDAGPPPVYIGFGSIVLDDPDKFTSIVFEAVEKTGVRALVSKGWGGLGGGDIPDNIFMLENTPHDWLFPRVSAVVHHGGAGTTAIGLKCGKPTMIVPFFGDQPFWGSMCSRSGAGSHHSVPYKKLTAQKLAEGILQCLTKEAQTNAATIAKDISKEGDGAANAVKSFHRSLTLRGERSMRCTILEDRVAVWVYKNTNFRLSALAADILVDRKKLSWKNLKTIRHKDWTDFEGPGEPVTGGGAALVSSATSVARGFASVPVRWAKGAKKREKKDSKKKQKKQESQGKSGKSSKPPTNDHGDGQRELDPPTTGIEALDHAKGPEEQAQTRIPQLAEANQTIESWDDESDVPEEAIDGVAREMVATVGKGLEQSGEALAKAPMNLSLAIAQGFHNAPRLYGDDTVRRPRRITGIQSGMRAAGSEFVLGVYDGVTGLVVHPYEGAREDGLIGLTKGVGKGVGGFVLKDLAALVGPFGLTLKGVHKQIQRDRASYNHIRRSRIIQGQREAKMLSPEERKAAGEAVGRGWKIFSEITHEVEQTRAEGLKGRWRAQRQIKAWRKVGALENVNQAKKALRATKQGKPIAEVFQEQKAELRKSEAPRKSTIGSPDMISKEADVDPASADAPAMASATVATEDLITNGHVSIEDKARNDPESTTIRKPRSFVAQMTKTKSDPTDGTPEMASMNGVVS
ncbi:MAG: hypothetical protein M4579_005200 [Chaenotheca gracillima]|nr:MAG: hypothetical protein M4579_005200 [Chaenotheca gracillima]